MKSTIIINFDSEKEPQIIIESNYKDVPINEEPGFLINIVSQALVILLHETVRKYDAKLAPTFRNVIKNIEEITFGTDIRTLSLNEESMACEDCRLEIMMANPSRSDAEFWCQVCRDKIPDCLDFKIPIRCKSCSLMQNLCKFCAKSLVEINQKST